MKILLAADGSSFTRKALAFLIANERLDADEDELMVLNVQPLLSGHEHVFAHAEIVSVWHRDEARQVLDPIEHILTLHEVRHRTRWVVGRSADEILRTAAAECAGLIVMGTHGQGGASHAAMGSVALQVLHAATVPVLLVK